MLYSHIDHELYAKFPLNSCFGGKTLKGKQIEREIRKLEQVDDNRVLVGT